MATVTLEGMFVHVHSQWSSSQNELDSGSLGVWLEGNSLYLSMERPKDVHKIAQGLKGSGILNLA